jgi:tellurium resistance protein TerD
MAINLVKGQRAEVGLRKLNVGLGWDPNETGQTADLDLSAFGLSESGKLVEEKFFVFFQNLSSPDQAIVSSGDDRSGESSDGGDDETIVVDLAKLDSRVEQIIFTATIYDSRNKKQNFGQIRNAYVRICDASTQEEICKYELCEDFSIEMAVEFGRLYKRNGEWKFEAIGNGFAEEIEYLLNKYA